MIEESGEQQVIAINLANGRHSTLGGPIPKVAPKRRSAR